MKFLIDMPLSPELAAWLRQLGHDAVHAVEVDLGRASDTEIIAHARRKGRTIVTADLDYPRLLALSQLVAPSLLLFRDGRWSEADVRLRISHLLRSVTEADIERSIFVVERDRVRRRRLPIG